MLPFSGAAVIVIKNVLGPVIVAGEDSGATIHYFIDKWISSERTPPHPSLFSEIQVESQARGDTLILSLSTPSPAAGTVSTALLSLRVPADVPCRVELSTGSADAYDLNAPLLINAYGTVTVVRQSGSCIATTAIGDISAEIALPDSGACILTTGRGNIGVLLPSISSAHVVGTTGSGTITSSGLAFSVTLQTPSTFSGTLGTGTAQVSLTTGAGNIKIQGF